MIQQKVLARLTLLALLLSQALVLSAESGVLCVKASSDKLEIKLASDGNFLDLVELPGIESPEAVAAAKALFSIRSGEKTVKLPRFDGERDRIYSAFTARDSAQKPVGRPHFAEDLEKFSKDQSPLPKVLSKKGLQVQMVDDAIALGVKHAALNVNLSSLIQLNQNTESVVWQMDGHSYFFNRRAVENIPVKPLSDAGIQVTLILLNYTSKDPAIDRIFRPTRSDAKSPNGIHAFNVNDPDGLRYYKACIEFLADRFSAKDSPHGRVCGYIVGNEVNSHWYWYNLGEIPFEDLAANYLRALRMTHTAVRKFSAHARVYISLDHHWSKAMGADTGKTISGKALVDYLNEQSKLGGDFDWHIAHHPYPSNLFEPRTWNDKVAAETNAHKITFKNLEQLPRYLSEKALRYKNSPRRVILSEQGFHTPDDPDGEDIQAAGYCYAYRKVAELDGIDAFILHRHVDHKAEGGLKLGLWTWKEAGQSSPGRQKKIYDVFKRADTPEWKEAFKFALPIIGLKSWSELKSDPQRSAVHPH